MEHTELATHIGRIEDQGYTVLEHVIDDDLVDALNEALDRLERDLDVVPSENAFEGRKTVRIYNLLTFGEPFTLVPVHAEVLPVVEGVLDAGCLVSSLSSISICAGERGQPLHADDQLLPLPRPHVPIVCNTMWALTDFTADNGATRLVPRSHHDAGLPNFKGEDGEIAAEMGRGSVLVWNGSLWHGGGANRTDDRRVGIAMNYCAGWVRQQENQQLGVPREVVAGFPERLQRLVGYGVYNGLVGHVEKHDPIEMLQDGGAPHHMVWEALP